MARKSSIPATTLAVRAWLKGTTVGRQLLSELTTESYAGFLEEKCRACQNPNLRLKPKVLVVVRRLGSLPGAEVYYESGVNVRMEELIDTYDNKAIEILSERVLELQLPKAWRHLPLSCRSQSDVFRGLSAERRLYYLELQRILRELRV